ncbi:nucleotidyltransferase-like protein [Paenibacillus pini]|uniref:Nucleotidyltransferase-like domain-containing protein n=1 Tax=Paenibacillus pini JCM 16418 TaxID=1236976 RepID=W7YQD2_9BACL|nr:nucleotidyltransferase-like protein [Paenibacillus pini]GAF10747.1 hypothetical protein JCM16418_4967 [Paenibacillus pini JCM 16418]
MSNLSFFYGESVDVDAMGTIIYRQQGHKFDGSLLHDFDLLVLIVHEQDEMEPLVEHTMAGELRCQVQHINRDSLQRWLIAREKNDLVKCFLEGEIIKDSDNRLAQLRQEYREFVQPLRDQKMFFEFARFLWMYVDAKRHMQDGHIMDAYHSVLDSLKHWASIELIERGIFPEPVVWEQVRSRNTAIHKLYEELTLSTETLEQRVELVLLACEFSVMSKMSQCSNSLMQIMGSRSHPWTINELIHHPELSIVSNELPLVLRKLVNRSLIKELPVWSEHAGYGAQEICYCVD